MTKQHIINRMELLSKEYNELAEKLIYNEAGNEGGPHYESVMPKEADYQLFLVNLKNENRQCQKEIKFLKDQLRRCNQQLNRYICNGELEAPVEYKNITKEKLMSRQSVFKLNSLLLAYDEVIDEQENNIKSLSNSLEESLKQMRILTDENNRLHNYSKTYADENYDHEDFRVIAKDAKLLLEERDLLLKEVNMLTQAQDQFKKQYTHKIERVDKALLEEKKSNAALQKTLKETRKELEFLHEENKTLVEQAKKSVDEQEHKIAVEKCSRYFEKLKEAYSNDSCSMKKKINDVEYQKKQMEDLLQTSKKKVRGMKFEVVSYRKRLNALLEDRKKLLKEQQRVRSESKKLSREVARKSEEIGKLHMKLKDDRLKAKQQLAEFDGHRIASEEAWKKATRDSERLRTLLRSKEESIQALQGSF